MSQAAAIDTKDELGWGHKGGRRWILELTNPVAAAPKLATGL